AGEAGRCRRLVLADETASDVDVRSGFWTWPARFHARVRPARRRSPSSSSGSRERLRTTEMTSFSRRSVLKPAALVPVAGQAGCVRFIPTNRSVNVPAAVDGDVAIALAQAPELSRTGGAIVAHPDGAPGGYLVANTGAGCLALGARR